MAVILPLITPDSPDRYKYLIMNNNTIYKGLIHQGRSGVSGTIREIRGKFFRESRYSGGKLIFFEDQPLSSQIRAYDMY